MAREFAQIRLDIWNDTDFRDLGGNAQHLYFMLLTAPSLTYCGVADWRPGRLAALVGDWTADTVRAAAVELRRELFIVTDEETEEVLIRSFVKHDGIMRNSKMATAMATAAAGVASRTLRGVLVYTLQRMHAKSPELSGFNSKTAAAMLEREAIDPAVLLGADAHYIAPVTPMPSVIESPNGSVIGTPIGTPMSTPIGSVTASPTPIPTPTTDTSNEVSEREGRASATPPAEGAVIDENGFPYASTILDAEPEPAKPKPKAKRATRCPEGWMPSDKTVTFLEAKYPLVNWREEVVPMWEWSNAAPASKGTKVDWDLTFRGWIRRKAEDRAQQSQRRMTARERNFAESAAIIAADPRVSGGVGHLGEQLDLVEATPLPPVRMLGRGA